MVARVQDQGRRCTVKEYEGTWRDDEVFYILIGVVATKLHTFTKTLVTVHLKVKS